MICENCNSEHTGKFGSGRFCCMKCARAFGTKDKRKEISSKVSNKMRKFTPYVTACKVCETPFTKNTKTVRTCSKSCGLKMRYQDPEQRKITSNSVIGKTGGWRNFGGNGKKGTYSGIIFQSSWELIWIMYHVERNIPFRRCTEFFEYEFAGKIRKYYPDFYLENTKEYVEVKGFPSPLTEAKINAVKNLGLKITVIGKNEIAKFR